MIILRVKNIWSYYSNYYSALQEETLKKNLELERLLEGVFWGFALEKCVFRKPIGDALRVHFIFLLSLLSVLI